jgi:hypothetical protein
MSKPLERATRDAFGWERAQFLDVEAARRNAREPLRQLPRVMIPFEAVRRCIDAVRFPTLLMGPELEKWLSQHVERLDGISCPSRLQRAQLGAARWLTEAPEPEFEATEGAPEDGPALSGDDAELSALLQGRPELDEAEARRAIMPGVFIVNRKEFVSMRLGLQNVAVKIVQIGHHGSLRRFVSPADGRARAGGGSSLARAMGALS